MTIAILQKTKLRLRNATNLLKITQPEGSGSDACVQVPLTPNLIIIFSSTKLITKHLIFLKGLLWIPGTPLSLFPG